MIALFCALLAAAPAAGTWSATKKAGEFHVALTLKPAAPQPGQPIEAIFDIVQVPDFTDATYGDRVPVSGLQFLLTVSGAHGSSRYLVHALSDAGAYGAHLRVAEKGLATLALASVGDTKGPSVEFQIGVGVPMPASAQSNATDNARDPVGDHAPSALAIDPGRKVMAEIARRWTDIDPERGGNAAAAQAIADLLGGMVGKAPTERGAAAGEFDHLVRDAQTELSSYAHGATSSAAYLRTAENACLRCHLKFRFGVTTDVAHFPDVEVKPWKR